MSRANSIVPATLDRSRFLTDFMLATNYPAFLPHHIASEDGAQTLDFIVVPAAGLEPALALPRKGF
jgi:hypothetical protein